MLLRYNGANYQEVISMQKRLCRLWVIVAVALGTCWGTGRTTAQEAELPKASRFDL